MINLLLKMLQNYREVLTLFNLVSKIPSLLQDSIKSILKIVKSIFFNT